MLLIALAVGAGLRLTGIGAEPAGLYQDEAYNGLDAVGVLEGARPLYFPANNGREPAYIYLAALSVGVLGRTPAAERLPAAFAGVLTIAAAYALGRALFGRRVGLLAAAVCAATFWPLALSRIGLRAGLLPPLAALSLACAAAGWRRGSLRLLALGGTLYGLSFYTYLAARFTPAALSIFLIFWYIAVHRTAPPARRTARAVLARSGAAFALPALAVAAPLLWFAAAQPEVFFGRAEQVSIFSAAVNGGNLWGALFDNLLKTLGMFVWRGDGIARHNLPGRPVFDPLLGAAFLLGVLVCARRALGARREAEAGLALIWTGVLALPTLLAADAPHFLRAAGMLPMVLVFPALGLEAVRARLRSRVGGGLVVAAVLLAGLGWTARDYFGRYLADPDTGYLFQGAATELAREANRTLGSGWKGGLAAVPGGVAESRVYVDRRLWDNFPSLRFLAPLREGMSILDDQQPPDFAPGARATIFLWPYEDPRPVLANAPAGMAVAPQAGPLARGDLEPAPYSLYSRYRLEPAGETGSAAAEFAGGLRLARASATAGPDGGLELRLRWEAGPAPGKDYQAFVHITAGGEIVQQADGPVGTSLYPSSWWRAGAVVEETRRSSLPAGLGAEDVVVRIGVYDPAGGARLERTDAPGDTVEIRVREQPGG